MIDSDVKRGLLLGGTVWEHYKGGVYVGLGLSTHTETRVKEFVYTDKSGELHHRPVEMFLENIEVNGELVERFKFAGLVFSQATN